MAHVGVVILATAGTTGMAMSGYTDDGSGGGHYRPPPPLTNGQPTLWLTAAVHGEGTRREKEAEALRLRHIGRCGKVPAPVRWQTTARHRWQQDWAETCARA